MIPCTCLAFQPISLEGLLVVVLVGTRRNVLHKGGPTPPYDHDSHGPDNNSNRRSNHNNNNIIIITLSLTIIIIIGPVGVMVIRGRGTLLSKT